MRKFEYILLIFALAFAFFSCEKQQPSAGFSLSADQITVGAEGGTEKVKISSGGSWIANTESPWITVSPTNGYGTVECDIKVDTTLIADEIRTGTVRFISEGREPLDLKVSQTGYEKMIVLSSTEVTIPNYGKYGARYFDVELTANVDFDLAIPEDATWVIKPDYDFSLDRGFRPRTVKLRIGWENNTRPFERSTVITFNPKDGIELARHDELKVTQEAADEIGDNRQGDSLAIVGCARSLGLDLAAYEGENMGTWDFVTVWEPGDEGYTEDKLGRVKSVKFNYFNTKDGIPYEIQYLTKLEYLSLFSNGNSFMKSFSTGEYLSKLTQLKKLEIFAFGLTELDDSFTQLKNLEYLDISANNFNEIPRILTPENFPKLKYLDIASQRRRYILDMTITTYDPEEWGGFNFETEFPEWLLRWDNLETLRLSNNYLRGTVPDMEDYEPRYTAADLAQNDTLPNGTNNPAKYSLLGKPKVLPNMKMLSINLNLFNGEIPEWILYHPHLMDWFPDILVFNQDETLTDMDGNNPGFSNIPVSPTYYYDAYPLKKPDYYDE